MTFNPTSSISIRLILVVFIVGIVSACGSSGTSESSSLSADELEAENARLKKEVATLDSMISRVGFGSKLLNSNLDSITRLEASLRDEMQKTGNDSVLIDKVKDIASLVSANRSIIEDLKAGMDGKNLSTKLLLDMILKLDDRIKGKEAQIGVLNANLDELGDQLETVLGNYARLQSGYANQSKGLAVYQSRIEHLKKEITTKDEELYSKENLLNKAFYFFGERKELISMGIIKKSNVFSTEINEDFDLSTLNKIDIRDFKELTVPGGKVKILSDHPKTSYSLDVGISQSKITISNPTQFWSVSKTLIIQTE